MQYERANGAENVCINTTDKPLAAKLIYIGNLNLCLIQKANVQQCEMTHEY